MKFSRSNAPIEAAVFPRIAVLVPCHNEEQTIASVVRNFRTALPAADIYVFDNNSSDLTVDCARNAGAIVKSVRDPGKGNVVRRMFADVEADVYVMVDGDDTYDAQSSASMINTLLTDGLDMMVGVRKTEEAAAYRTGHRFGNRLLTGAVRRLFGRTFTDMLSGYRVFSRRFAKSFPAHSRGFEIETELTVHALQLRMPVGEQVTAYRSRPENSTSKLNTYKDGFKILGTIIGLMKSERPLVFFSFGFALCVTLSVVLALPVLITFLQTGLVPRLPTVLLSASLGLLGMILLTCGLVLDTVTRGRIETKRLFYLMTPGYSIEETPLAIHQEIQD